MTPAGGTPLVAFVWIGRGDAFIGENIDGPGSGAGGIKPIRQLLDEGSVGRGVGEVFAGSATVRARPFRADWR
jgi:hypothetical protein